MISVSIGKKILNKAKLNYKIAFFFLFFSLKSFGGSCENSGFNAGNTPSGPTYILKKTPNEYNVSADLTHFNQRVDFYSSEDDYLGSEKYNEFNGVKVRATKDVTFDNLGPNWVGVDTSGLFFCKNVHVQSKPRISGSISGKAVKINYFIDKNSKNGVKNSNSEIIITSISDFWGTTKKVATFQANTGTGNLSRTINIPKGDPQKIYAEINDGTYKNKSYLGETFIPGTPTPPCPTSPCPIN